MDVKMVNPFLEATINVFNQFGLGEIKRTALVKKEKMEVSLDITTVISMIGDVYGNLALSLSSETARAIVSAMMGGMEIKSMDALAISAIAELSNMITGQAAVIFSKDGIMMDATPPSVISGHDILFVISRVQTLAVVYNTNFGPVEVNIGLEM